MLEPVPNIKTLLIEGSCSPINYFHRTIATVKKFYGRYHDLVDPYNIAVSKLISDLMAQSKHRKAFKYRIFIFTDLFDGYIDMAFR